MPTLCETTPETLRLGWRRGGAATVLALALGRPLACATRRRAPADVAARRGRGARLADGVGGVDDGRAVDDAGAVDGAGARVDDAGPADGAGPADEPAELQSPTLAAADAIDPAGLLREAKTSLLCVDQWGGEFSGGRKDAKFIAEPMTTDVPPTSRHVADASGFLKEVEAVLVDAGVDGVQFAQAKSVHGNYCPLETSQHLKAYFVKMGKHPQTKKDINMAPTANQSLFEGTIVDYAVKNAHRARLDFRYLMAPLYGTGYSADKHHDQHKKRGCRAVGGIFGGTKALSEFVQGVTPISPIRVVEIDDGDFQLMDTNVLTGAVPADAELLGPYAFWSIVGDFYGTDGVFGFELFSRVAGYLKHLNEFAKPSPRRAPSPSYAEYHAAHAVRVMREEAAKAVKGSNPRLQAMGQAYLVRANGRGLALKAVFDEKRDRDDFAKCVAVIAELRRELPKADSLFAVGVLDGDEDAPMELLTLGTVERDIESGDYASADAAIADARSVLCDAQSAAAMFDDLLAAAVDRRPGSAAALAEGAAPRPRAPSGLSAEQIEAAVASQSALAIAFGDRIAALQRLAAPGDGEPGAAAPASPPSSGSGPSATRATTPGARGGRGRRGAAARGADAAGPPGRPPPARPPSPAMAPAPPALMPPVVQGRPPPARPRSAVPPTLMLAPAHAATIAAVIAAGKPVRRAAPAADDAPPAPKRYKVSEKPSTWVVKLVEMIKQTDVICFEGGDIIIPSTAALEERLGDYYSTNKYLSFQRQLNNFGYKQDLLSSSKGGVRYRKVTGGETVTTVQDLLSLRPLPRRKSPPAGSASAPAAPEAQGAQAAPLEAPAAPTAAATTALSPAPPAFGETAPPAPAAAPSFGAAPVASSSFGATARRLRPGRRGPRPARVDDAPPAPKRYKVSEKPSTWVVKLVEMIKQTDVICFEGGDIIIPSTAALEERLGDYYKSAKYQSFQRQLNNFGYKQDLLSGGVRYRKVTGGETVTTVQDLLSLRPLPRRKSPPAGSASAPAAPKKRKAPEAAPPEAPAAPTAAATTALSPAPPAFGETAPPAPRRRRRGAAPVASLAGATAAPAFGPRRRRRRPSAPRPRRRRPSARPRRRPSGAPAAASPEGATAMAPACAATSAALAFGADDSRAAPAADDAPPAPKRYKVSEKPSTWVVKLVEMIKQTDVICFEGGDIIIPSTAALEERLGDYYKSAKYQSFQRQLNNFGYKQDLLSGGVRYRKVTGGETVTTVEDLLSLRPLPRRKSPAAAASASVASKKRKAP
ncbi:hypothetical protein JL722_5418 [Aureococcus anophagefferens]|nr:hypothetical protein JL722_5418 [Aureococcus anophagefferens]